MTTTMQSRMAAAGPRQASLLHRRTVQVSAGKGFGKPRQVKPVTQPTDPIVDPCPCSSGKNYKNCCQRIHTGELVAATPRAALNARFTAYVRNQPQYIINSTHEDFYQYQYNKPASDPDVQAKYKDDVEYGCTANVYADFKVVGEQPGTIEDEAEVAYSYKSAKAPAEGENVPEDGWLMTDEKARFLRVDGNWLFADAQTYTRNLSQLLKKVEENSQKEAAPAS